VVHVGVRPVEAWTVPRLSALVAGAIFTAVGVAGFLVTGIDGFAEDYGEPLLGLRVNPLHNLLHLGTGAVALLFARSTAGAGLFGVLLAGGYGLVFVYGLKAVGHPRADVLALNWADNVAHLIAALAGVAIAFAAWMSWGPGSRDRGKH